jgi:hypothetical protein
MPAAVADKSLEAHHHPAVLSLPQTKKLPTPHFSVAENKK